MKHIIFFLLLCACSTTPDSRTSIVPGLLQENGSRVLVHSPFQEERVLSLNDEGSRTIFLKRFSSPSQATSYAMERRLLILRKFETMVEPYFGTANANECHENLKSSEIEHQDQTFRAVIQLLSSGPERIIHDCLIVNNSHWLKVEFVTCKNVFYDIRTYSPVSGTRPDVSSEFKCES